ncbi:MAG: sialate O-acetylesterase [Oscillospiraceae bacterium]|nr:sialate O-acetylesterase [Oscillospiraceae bacterium]
MRFQVSAMFSDNMVLQRGKNIRVFGTGEDGVKITAQLCGFTTSCTVANGKWRLVFPPMGACRFTNLTLTDDETDDEIVFERVAIGEVWLVCGGAGMEPPLEDGTSEPSPEEPADVRCYAIPRRTVLDEDYESALKAAKWSDFNNGGYNGSAAGFYFAKTMSEYLNITVGIIECHYGETPTLSWLNTEGIGDVATVLSGVAPDAPRGKLSPGVLFESLIKPVCPYTLSGVLWYHGEADGERANAHFMNLVQVIDRWREAWGNHGLTFIIGQLPMLGDKPDDGDEYPLIREAQMKMYDIFKNMGICVLLDCADRKYAHEVGRRFAMQALNIINGGCDGACAPTLKDAIWRGDTVELQFNDARGGFKVEGDEPGGFEVCGTDGVYYPAIADVSGEKIFLTCEQVSQPVAVRYLWRNNAEIHIKSMFGLPIVPFRITM